jgi:phytoene/squalene synthetase
LNGTGLASNTPDLRIWLDQIALICLSEEFHKLKAELESIYREVNFPEAGVAAFADALYAFLTEHEEVSITAT